MKNLIFLILVLSTIKNIAVAIPKNIQIPYVIVISLDGFRYDYLERNITPNLQSIINNGIKATSLEPSFPTKTFPNHISIMTGMYPENHGVILNKFSHPITHESYSINDKKSITSSKWYKGEFLWETLKKNNILSASYFWPGSEISNSIRRPTYFQPYDHSASSSKILDTLKYWLSLSNSYRPHLITLYFHEVDDAGHRFGPNTPEVNTAIKKVDSILGKLMQLIVHSSLRDSINIIIVSDHGMTSLNKEKTILIEAPIKKQKYSIQYDPIICFIKPEKKEDTKIIYDSLKQHEKNYHVYLKSQIPDSLHFQNNEFIYDIVAIANLGYSFIKNPLDKEWIKGGNHGYIHTHKDMHGIFIAQGNLFKKNYTISKIKNIDIYPFLCYIFNVNPNKKIDGRLSPELLSTLQ